MPPPSCKLTFELLTSKVVFESYVTWTTSVPILVFLGLSILELGPMYATDRRQTKASGRRHNKQRVEHVQQMENDRRTKQCRHYIE